MAGPGYKKILSKIGNRAGTIVGIGEGVGQMISANKAKKRAADDMPEMVDPAQGAFLAELQQKKNALNTGSEYASSLDAIGDNMAQTQDTLAGNSGGDVGGTVSALLKSQMVANKGTGNMLAQGQQSEGMYTGLYGNLLDKVAQRKMELGLLGHAQNMAEWAQDKQAGMANITAGAQQMMDFNGSDKKAFTPSGVGDTTAAANNVINPSADTSESGPIKGMANAPATTGAANGGTNFLGKFKGVTGNGLGSSGKGAMDMSKISGILSSFGGK